MNPRSKPQRFAQQGIGMIEVLVALIAIALGLLGLAGLHCRAQQAELESYQRTQALILLEDMVNRLRANRLGKNSYVSCAEGTSCTLGTGVSFSGTGCANTQACSDLLDWHNALLGAAEAEASGTRIPALIGARGCITGGGNDFVVTVAWQGLLTNTAGLPTGDPRLTNTCGQGAYGTEAQRRIVSVPVRFFAVY